MPGAAAIGVASMLGAGIFFVWAPATAAAGSAVLIALPLAAVIAVLNATSTIRLAMRHPVSGGAYAYGRAELGPLPGFVAGVLFLLGKTASVAAIGLIAGGYLWPGAERVVAAGLIVVLAAINATGVRATALVSAIAAGLVVAALVVVLGIGAASAGPLATIPPPVPGWGVLTATGLIFFAFAGYARIATLGEEVRDPVRILPRAAALSIALVLVLSAATLLVLMSVLGPDRLAQSASPVAELVGDGSGGDGSGMAALVRAAAALACIGSLAGVLAGLSRTGLAMARDHELPAVLARLSRTSTPVVSDAVTGVVALAAVLLLSPAQVVGVSACAVLGYYAVAHLAALRAGPSLGVPRGIPIAGLAGCLAVAFATPWPALVGVTAAVLVAVGVRALVQARHSGVA